MNCDRFELLCEEFLCNELNDPSLHRKFLVHLGRCDSCYNRYWEAKNITVKLMDAGRSRLDFIETTPPPFPRKRFSQRLVMKVAAFMSIFLSGLFGCYLYTVDQQARYSRYKVLSRITRSMIPDRDSVFQQDSFNSTADSGTSGNFWSNGISSRDRSYFDSNDFSENHHFHINIKEEYDDEKSYFTDHSYSSWF